MTIPLECINLIIPIHKLRKKAAKAIADIDAFLGEQTSQGYGCWRDEHLYREGAMNPLELEMLLDKWKKAGLRLTRKKAGVTEWDDVCVVDTTSGPTLPCSWLKYNLDTGSAWLAGTPGAKTYVPETIIFLHGKESTPDSSSSARSVKEYFKQDKVLVPDYRPLERSHEEIESYLSDVIEKAGTEVSLVGISLGGYLAYRMACKSPNVSRCILLNPSFRCYPDVPVCDPKPRLPITIVVNMDDEIVNPADALERFRGRAAMISFDHGGHRFENREEMLGEIRKAMNHICE
jgi:predicted esterase YcpF (UPF0227 family)